MVERAVPDELTVSVPPRMGLVLIVHACTHRAESQTPLPKNKGSEAQIINNYIPITPRGEACRMDVVLFRWHTCTYVQLGMGKEDVTLSLASPA